MVSRSLPRATRLAGRESGDQGPVSRDLPVGGVDEFPVTRPRQQLPLLLQGRSPPCRHDREQVIHRADQAAGDLDGPPAVMAYLVEGQPDVVVPREAGGDDPELPRLVQA